MTNSSLELARQVLYAVCALTAASAFVAVVVLIIRHAISSGDSVVETDRVLDRGKRIVGFVFAISFLAGGGGLAISSTVTSGNAGWNLINASTNNSSPFLPGSWTGDAGLKGWTSDGTYVYGDLPSDFVDDGSSAASELKAAAQALADAKTTADQQAIQEAEAYYNQVAEKYYADKLIVSNDAGLQAGSDGGGDGSAGWGTETQEGPLMHYAETHGGRV